MPESHWHSVTGKAKYKAHPDHDTLKKLSFTDTVNMFYDKRIGLSHQGWSLQKEYVVNLENNMELDFLIDYNNINSEIKSRFGIDLPVVNKSNRHAYKEYYTEETISKIAEIYQEDIKLFNFNYE
jgi:hypothetical protein